MTSAPAAEGAVAWTPESEHIWEGFARGVIPLQRCVSCDEIRFVPGRVCRVCGGTTIELVTASGRGTVYSYIITRRPASLPLIDEYPVIALVELEEGPRMIANLVGVDPADAQIGMPVVAVFDAAPGGQAVARFQPASEHRA